MPPLKKKKAICFDLCQENGVSCVELIPQPRIRKIRMWGRTVCNPKTDMKKRDKQTIRIISSRSVSEPELTDSEPGEKEEKEGDCISSCYFLHSKLLVVIFNAYF